ncbi:uncharacterized protein FIESC28_05649 [Fusarium coffeatum]|uniref:N-acetyltransferase domain-containing protein n=1 Tax=Fusarium coffeatum TaxID=231269 RepID=A0A366RQ11_9HYPO|nr:uncharacterized protein FIESC28_05649 [Fusarium coffeatum]RBR19184.1 hypothetical protein FIESC28_05649 [Fusarium coffeatum]
MSQPSEPPPLYIGCLISLHEQQAALKLIADSVAQQRQTASRALIFNPILLSFLAACLAAAHYSSSDIGNMLIIYPGIVLTYLVAVRYFTSAYIRIAEETKWAKWAKNDILIGARFGEDIVGAVVMRLQRKLETEYVEDSTGWETGEAFMKMPPRAIIRGWTTKTRYRGRGLGGDMLGKSVEIAKERMGRNCRVDFAKDHANSHMPLYTIFNGPFLEREAKAKRALGAKLKDWEKKNPWR